MKTRVTKILGDRPTSTPAGAAIPPDALIYNAPRPLYGSVRGDLGAIGESRLVWRGEFIAGIFYAAVLRDDPDRALWIDRNRQQDADLIEWISKDKIRAALIECYQRGYEMTEAEARAEIDAADQGDFLLTYFRAQGLHSEMREINV